MKYQFAILMMIWAFVFMFIILAVFHDYQEPIISRQAHDRQHVYTIYDQQPWNDGRTLYRATSYGCGAKCWHRKSIEFLDAPAKFGISDTVFVYFYPVEE